jgi:hypothetical protein
LHCRPSNPPEQETALRALLTLAALAAVISLTACNTSDSRVSSGTAGEAYRDVDRIYTLYIMPVDLPGEIHGNATEEEKDRWQTDWPMTGARLIARGVTDETDERVIALVSEDKPKADYYFELVITYLDVGDADVRAANILDPDEEGWSQVIATGTIIRASDGEVVAELRFDQSSGYEVKEPFQNDMSNLGQDLGNWLESRQ